MTPKRTLMPMSGHLDFVRPGTFDTVSSEQTMPPTEAEIAAAWIRLVNDCGCSDIYYCGASRDIECPRHSGFDTCCIRISEHVPVR